ncbi:MAG: helix-turn-helix domain-containing protein [Candidatus Pacebacteria bacterium]|nr:helix-turn-helix domain-containing protein [Candidatus Paceibacterota bacterium]
MNRQRRFEVEDPRLPCLPLYVVYEVEEQKVPGRYEVNIHEERQQALLEALTGSGFPIGAEIRLVNVRMKMLRVGRNLSQKDLGKLIGVSGSTICHFETLRAFPDEKLAEKIAKVLDTTVEALFPEWLEFLVNEPVETVRKLTNEEIEKLRIDQYLVPVVIHVRDRVEKNILCQMVRELISLLPERECNMLSRWMGIGCSRQTMAEIAEVYELSDCRVQQIIQKAFRRLRHSRRPNLRALMELLEKEWTS